MEAVKGDFTGFTFKINGEDAIHSSQLGIIRVSNGDRYDETLHPEINDKTTEVPGMDGNYYFGSDYGVRNIEIQIAYDSLTEKQLRDIRKLFGRKQIGELIFDERPYKKYLVKLESPIELSYICFDEVKREPSTISRDGVRVAERDAEGIIISREQVYPWIVDSTKTMRVYKGEGTISFVAYYPFAKSVFKVLPIDGYDNINDWAVSSGILSANDATDVDTYMDLSANTKGFKIYNAGDIKTGFRLYCPKPYEYILFSETEEEFDVHKQYYILVDEEYVLVETPRIEDVNTYYIKQAIQTPSNITIVYQPYPGKETTFLSIENLVIDEDDMGIIINTDNNLIEGVLYTIDGFTTTGRIYNNYITSGNFFKFETNNTKNEATLIISGSLATQPLDIYYDYLYF